MPFGGRQHKQLQKKLHQYIEIFPKIIINININHFLFQILMKKIMKTKLRIGIKISVRTRVTEGSIWRHHQTGVHNDENHGRFAGARIPCNIKSHFRGICIQI